MTTATLVQPTLKADISTIQDRVNQLIDQTMASLPPVETLTPEQRRGIIARYSAVLEGNFIYWMTAILLAIKSEDAKPVILENLHEEIHESHPNMMRNFAIAAGAFPTAQDSLSLSHELTAVRLFLGRLDPVPSLVLMAYFEGLIQKFMTPLAAMAAAQGSTDMVYTDVHGVCDIAHTAGLFESLAYEMAINPPAEGTDIYEGLDLLRTLFDKIITS
jgi:hypothetical protein